MLVNKHDDAQAYGPADIVQMYPSFGPRPAAHGVIRMAKVAKLEAEELEAVSNFLRQWPEGPQLEPE